MVTQGAAVRHQFHALRVRTVHAITRDAIAITLDVPPELVATFRYEQGQYLTLRSQIDGEEVRRSYSICSAVQHQLLRVAIKRVVTGVFSNWAAETLKPGMVIEAMAPQGGFYALPDDDAPHNVLAVACGSGITPVLSIVESLLLAEPHGSVTLVYGNRSSSSVMFKEEIEDLKDRYLGRLNLVWIMSRESQDIELFHGRIDYDKCMQLFDRWLDPGLFDQTFICGPHDMMQATTRALQDKGVAASAIRTELFAAAASGDRVRAPRQAVQGGDQCEVQVVLDGTRHRFSMAKNRDNLVNAGLQAGLEMPYACKGGVCSTCRGLVVEGEVDMDVNFALEDYEVARGFVLCCQSYPVTDTLVIDFDRDHAHS